MVKYIKLKTPSSAQHRRKRSINQHTHTLPAGLCAIHIPENNIVKYSQKGK